MVTSQKLLIEYDAIAVHSNEILQKMPHLENNVVYRYSLKIDGQKSVFKRDSLKVLKMTSFNSKEYWVKEEIFKDHINEIWLKTSSLYKLNSGYKRNLSVLVKNNSHDWKLTGKEKKILGLKVIEVEGKKGTAWYSPEIPLPDGPEFGVFGLPGLVMEFINNSGHWLAVNISDDINISVTEPIVNTSTEESQIKLSVFEVKSLPKNEIIIIDNQKPINQWIKFND